MRDVARHCDRHTLAAEDGRYPCEFKAGGWEERVLQAELRETDLVA